MIINADAIQVFDNWRVLTARPSVADEARAPHALYGHIAWDADYSVGHWLRDLAPLLVDWKAGGDRPIIVGGTGLYFMALTEGLADIPATPNAVRSVANQRREGGDLQGLLDELDAATHAMIDAQNPMRVQRAWEVLQTTGRGLADWQAKTPAPLLPLAQSQPIVMDCDVNWLNARIARRFDAMLDQGALDEAQAMQSRWNPALLSCKAIGAPELIAHLNGTLTLDQARDAATIATRQFAKRQRTWFRKRMRDWQAVSANG